MLGYEVRVEKWLGSKPERCDICRCSLSDGEYFVDGRTSLGPWGLLCKECHRKHGCGFGLGRGQAYNTRTLEKISKP